MKLLHLRGRKINESLLRKGNIWKGKTMIARWMAGPPFIKGQKDKPPREGLYLGTYASAKLHKSAVVRNRMRRRCREAVRVVVQEHTEIPTAQLLITPKSASLDASFAELQADVQTLLSILPPWPTKNPQSVSSNSSRSSG